MRGDDVRLERGVDDVEAALQRDLPELHLVPPPVEPRVAAPDVVDQDVEPPLLPADAGDETAHLRRFAMIGADGDRASAVAHDQLRGLVDCFGTAFRRWMTPRAAAAAVD